jgi:phosphoglycolate phosphatase
MQTLNYKGIIFDFDGTLADTLEDLADSMNRILFWRGFPAHEYNEYKLFVGRGLENLVSNALPEKYRDAAIIADIYSEMKKEYRLNCLNKSRLYRGIPELLDQLTGRQTRLAIFSNKADDIVIKMAKSLLSSWNFEIILGSRPDIPKKPDPSGALFICGKLDIPSESMIYLGDSGLDMITARSAGIFPVGVLWGFRSGKELLDNGAGMLISHPLELIQGK